MLLHRSAACLAAIVVSLAACATGTDTQDAASAVTVTDDAVILTSADNGKVVEVPLGKKIIVRLASNPSTGASWKATAFDRTFGGGDVTYEAGPNSDRRVGAPGTAVFTWLTDHSFFDLVGSHGVTLTYTGPGGNVFDTFTFSAHITRGAPVTDGYAMPAPVVSYFRTHGWGDMHLRWHTERRWDSLGSSDQQWATDQGWKRATTQEGQTGNGLAFLAMHRDMLQMLRDQFPDSASLFDGWRSPPNGSTDELGPLPGDASSAFDPAMRTAIDTLTNRLDSFASDDELGLFIETSMGSRRSGAGVHNYLHNRFTDPSSPITMGDPSVNMENRVFWRLHGWIDARWTAYRAQKGLNDATDATYQGALMDEMRAMHAVVVRGTGTTPTPIPATLRSGLFSQP